MRTGIDELVAAYGADEVIVVTITHDHAARRRSYELVAETMDLTPELGDGASSAALTTPPRS